MNRVITLLAAFLLITAPLMAQDRKAVLKSLKGVEKDLEVLLEDWKVAGFAVAVVDQNGVVYSKGFGYRDYENKIPADANTLFAIGSCTKAFTSAILGKLEKDGELSLDDKPGKYIPELQFSTNELNDQVNIRDMMVHRTGLPRHDFSWYLFPTFSKDTLIRRIEFHKPWTGVRERWYYNNFMFLTQGVVAERITGKGWGDLVKDYFFKPLGMERSNVSIAELEKASNISIGYQVAKDKIKSMDYYKIAAMAPAGSINSSVNEMGNWVSMWINRGKYKGEEVIPAGYASSAMSSHSVINGGLPSKEVPDAHFANYGYGWFLSSYKGHYRVEHGGNIDGFSASTSFFPTDSLGIVVLVNQNGSAVTGLARNIISDRILKVERTDWNENAKKSRAEGEKLQKNMQSNKYAGRVNGTSPSHAAPEYTGKYDNPGYGEFTVELKNDSLFAHFKRVDLYLKHYHYDVFEPFMMDDGKVDTTASLGGVMMNFITATGGEIKEVQMNIEPALPDDPIVFARTPTGVKLTEEDLQKYVGDYDLGPQTIKMLTKGDILYLSVPGQPEYELLSTSEHKFVFKALSGFKVEFQLEDGAVTGAKVIQPNGTFMAKKK